MRGTHSITVGLVALALLPSLLGGDIRPPTSALKPYVEGIPGSNVRFEMVPLPGGRFRRGSDAEAGRREDEGPVHDVTVRPFWMGAREVTWDEYDRFWLDEK